MGRSESTYNCQEVDLENWEDRCGLFEQYRDYYDIAGPAGRYTCLLHYCENYEFLCTPRYTKISGLCTFWYITFRVYELFWYVNFGYMHFRFYATLPKFGVNTDATFSLISLKLIHRLGSYGDFNFVKNVCNRSSCRTYKI